jgi:hypothetical protein
MILGESTGIYVRVLSLRAADIVDHVEPVMLIVGSRGIGQLKGLVSYSSSCTSLTLIYTLNTEFFWAQLRTT